MTAQRIASSPTDQGDRDTPITRQPLFGRQHDLAQKCVDDKRQQLVLGAYAVVQGHRPGVEFSGQSSHRDRLETLGIGDANGRGVDVVAAEAGLSAGPIYPRPHIDGFEVCRKAIQCLDVLGSQQTDRRWSTPAHLAPHDRGDVGRVQSTGEDPHMLVPQLLVERLDVFVHLLDHFGAGSGSPSTM